MESFLIVAGLYFLPTVVALARKVPSVGSVFVINLFLGWTLIGWVVALAMSARHVPQTHLDEIAARAAVRRGPDRELPPVGPPTPGPTWPWRR